MDETINNGTGTNTENTDDNDSRTVELDISDVKQRIPEGEPVSDTDYEPERKKGWKGLLFFTFSVAAVCMVAIFLLTSIFQGSFFFRNKQEQVTSQDNLEIGEPSGILDETETTETEVPLQTPADTTIITQPVITIDPRPAQPISPVSQIPETPEAPVSNKQDTLAKQEFQIQEPD